jgi:acetamidase/formamidase
LVYLIIAIVLPEHHSHEPVLPVTTASSNTSHRKRLSIPPSDQNNLLACLAVFQEMAHSFHVHSDKAHLRWSRAIPPVLAVPSGSTLSFDLKDGGNNQIRPDNADTALSTFDLTAADPAFGPVFVTGAEPGDVLKVEILELRTGTYGWTAIFPGFGLLADEFPEPQLKMWEIRNSDSDDTPAFLAFKPGICIPVRPFLGIMGLAPGEDGEFSTIPPYATGGNIDCKHITVGSTLYLPIKVEGALFSCGDGHAAQGDGEVCGTAIETPMNARIRLTVMKGMPWVESPHYMTAPKAQDAVPKDSSTGAEYAALGIDSDLREATRKAVKGLIGWLVAEKGLTKVESYMLASVAADLKMVEVVDMPNYGIACSLPLSVFVEE